MEIKALGGVPRRMLTGKFGSLFESEICNPRNCLVTAGVEWHFFVKVALISLEEALA